MRRKLSALMLLLFFCLSSSAAGSVLKLSFELVNKCPTAAASLVPHKLSSKLQCAASCSRLPTCNAFHFDKLTRHCFHGDACSRLEQWTDGDHCESYKYTDVLCGDCAAAEPMLAQLKLKLFYKFSRSGVNNEANPRQFCLTAHDVTIDGGGAHFKGHTGSYLSTETPGFENILGVGSTYSTFVQVRHVMRAGYQIYNRFQSCTGTRLGSALIKFDSSFYGFAWLSINGDVGERILDFSSSFLRNDGAEYFLSAGSTFNRFGFERLYENGSFVNISSPSKYPLDSSTAAFQCLRLGYAQNDANCLNGSMFCFALSTKLFDGSEFHLLQNLCN